MRLNSSLFRNDTDTLLNAGRTSRLSGNDAHSAVRGVLIIGKAPPVKLLPTIEVINHHRLRAQNLFRLWYGSVNGATAKQPTYIGQGYAMRTRLKATDVEDSLTMVLGHGYYYGGKPSASLHHIKPAVISQPRQRQPAQILVLPPRAQGDDSGISVRGDGEDIVVRPRPNRFFTI